MKFLENKIKKYFEWSIRWLTLDLELQQWPRYLLWIDVLHSSLRVMKRFDSEILKHCNNVCDGSLSTKAFWML